MWCIEMLDKTKLAVAILAVAILSMATYFTLDLLTPREIRAYDATFTVIPNGGGIYLKIYNGLDKQICLVDADILDVEGEMVMIHQTVRSGGIEKMVPVDEICIAPGDEFKLERGGYHIMFSGVDVKDYDKLRVKLIFKDGEEVVVEAVKKLTI